MALPRVHLIQRAHGGFRGDHVACVKNLLVIPAKAGTQGLKFVVPTEAEGPTVSSLIQK